MSGFTTLLVMHMHHALLILTMMSYSSNTLVNALLPQQTQSTAHFAACLKNDELRMYSVFCSAILHNISSHRYREWELYIILNDA